jgi:hypothetical protein
MNDTGVPSAAKKDTTQCLAQKSFPYSEYNVKAFPYSKYNVKIQPEIQYPTKNARASNQSTVICATAGTTAKKR